MLVEARVFAREQGVDKKRRNFIERHAQPVRAGEPTVYFSVDIEHCVAFRHRAHFFHVEARGPGTIKNQQCHSATNDQKQKRYLPAVTEKFAALFPARFEPGKKFHSGELRI